MAKNDPVWTERDRQAVRNVFRYYSPRYRKPSAQRTLKMAEHVFNTMGTPVEWNKL